MAAQLIIRQRGMFLQMWWTIAHNLSISYEWPAQHFLLESLENEKCAIDYCASGLGNFNKDHSMKKIAIGMYNKLNMNFKLSTESSLRD